MSRTDKDINKTLDALIEEVVQESMEELG